MPDFLVIGAVGWAITSGIGSVVPVSYTHLDVYKRQICGFASGIAKGVLRTLALLPQLVSEIRIFLASHRLHPLYFLHFG